MLRDDLPHHLTVGVVAHRAGLRPSAVRYYETRGLLPRAERGANGYRLYPVDAVAWLRFVRRAQAFGMTLSEIKQLLQLTGRGERPCGRVRGIARERLRDVETRIGELTLLRGELRGLLRRRARRQTGQLCPLIAEVLPHAEAACRVSPRKRRPMLLAAHPATPSQSGASF